MTTPKAILLASLIASVAILIASFRPTYAVTVEPGKGYVKVNETTGEVLMCEVSMNQGLGTLHGDCRSVQERHS
jgi:hypothetical protein